MYTGRKVNIGKINFSLHVKDKIHKSTRIGDNANQLIKIFNETIKTVTAVGLEPTTPGL